MKLGSFYLQMNWLIARLIPDISDDYRSQDSEPDYRVSIWEERNNLQIICTNSDGEDITWTDDEARQMFDDGFFKRGKDLEASVIEYVKERRLIPVKPSMTLTVGADAQGWGYQTDDNSYMGGAYIYSRPWAVVTLTRDSDPHEVAEEIISQLQECEDDGEPPTFEPVAFKDERPTLYNLRQLARGRVHGGYVWAAVMDDGELVCETCARKEFRTVFKSTRDRSNDGWTVTSLTHSGESDSTETCAHCHKVIWSHES